MSRLTRSSLLLVASLPVLLPAPALGQSAEGGPKVLQLHPGAADISLGTAAPLSRPGAERIFQNPAAIAGGGFSAGLTRFGSSSSHAYLAGATEWAGGAVAVAAQTLSYSTDAGSISDIPGGPDPLPGSGGRDIAELVIVGAYALEVGGMQWGVGTKLVEQRFGGGKSGTLGWDVGVVRDIGPLTVGAAARNLGWDLERDGATQPLAERLTVGVAGHGWVVGPVDLGATGALHREADGRWIPAAGFEVAWWPVIGRTFVGRVGVRRVVDSASDPLTFGAAFIADAVTLEYAYMGFEDLDGAHTVSLSWR